MDEDEEFYSKPLTPQEVESIKNDSKPADKTLGLINLVIYGVVFVACLVLIGWLIFS